ncbi:MAG TPA: N-acetylglucosamine-6-phosphate deacetylase [Anaerolineales bacterium]|nr:N-acetylglucosamine-6-phosphate deacetylase [Anaerolineales bacterium]
MRTLVVGGTLLTPQDSLPDHALLIERGRILGIEPGRPKAGAQDQVIEADGLWVAPGLIDIHVHGALGHDPMRASVAAIHGMARFFAQHGVTSYLPTTLAATPAQTLAAVQSVAECPQPADGAQHLGVHIEGPYLNPEHRGAQPVEQLRDPDPDEYRAWLETGAVRLVTIAPERPGALEFIDLAVAQGVEFAIGHSGASYEQVVLAAEHGLRQATHTFNGMLGLNHRLPGTVGGVLTDDRIYAQVIADGVHLHPAVVKLILRAKGVARTILITDAISPTGLPDGEYQLTGLKITLQDGISRTSAGGLAGSTLTLEAGVRYAMLFAGVSLSDALTMATWAPAEAMGWSGKKGRLAPGADADIILLDEKLNVHWTMVAGRVVHPRPTQ